MTLTEFLLARIAEDEDAARNANEGGQDGGQWWATGRDRKVWGSPSARVPVAAVHSWRAVDHIASHDPARVLAECEAKRRIIEDAHFDGRSGDYIEPWCWTCSGDEDLEMLPCPTLRLLALPYTDHPDYRDEWRA